MTHEIQQVVGFRKVRSHTLKVDFSDGTCQTIDFSPVLRGDLYGPLVDESVFDQVELDTEAHTLVWPNGADFDPAILHDWPERKDDFERMAADWDSCVAP